MQGTPLTRMPGLGEAMAERLGRLGITSQEDLLLHLPHRYQDRTRVQSIAGLKQEEEAGCRGRIRSAETVGRQRNMYLVTVEDGTGLLTLRFFQVWSALKQKLQVGRGIWVFGMVRAGPTGLEMAHPEYEVADAEPPQPPEHLTPIYPLTEGVSHNRMRGWIGHALDHTAPLWPDLLPEAFRAEHGWPSLAEALETVHRPSPDVAVEALQGFRTPAQRRLAFEELLAHHLALRQARSASEGAAPPLADGGGLEEQFRAGLPFALTAAQERAWAAIESDLLAPGGEPMQRLLQGDVGSGKTVVAAMAVIRAVACGYQAAFMAPTEILAEQHAATLAEWLRPLGIGVYLVTGRLGAAELRARKAAMASGSAHVVVGTHALFQSDTAFHRLGLVVIDEQHRFGVHQRLALWAKGAEPHLLIMTATPIPRTLAMTAFADLAVTVIDELPPGRQPVTTVALADDRRDEVEARIRAAVARGERAYWVCPLVTESDAMQLEAAEEAYERLTERFPELAVGLIHGQMGAEAKEGAMAAFQSGATQLLVATPVIEVGVDVPDATLMVIEHAERMGLSQLHQLRGRVGRGGQRAVCVLLYRGPLSDKARRRIAAMRATNDGFRIAQTDLELRGPGEVLGARQTGLEQMRVADLGRDRDLVGWLPAAAEALLAQAPESASELVGRWVGERAELGRVG